MIGIFAATAGVLTWTFMEYGLHYWLFHLGRGRNFGSREHLHHHADPTYFSPLRYKVAFAVLVLGATDFVGRALLPPSFMGPFTAGVGAGFAGYEWYHWHLHVAAPRTRVGAFLRRHHFHHHFVAPLENHGVTSAVWDHVFGTYVAPPPRVPVPRKHARALPWVLGEDGEVAAAHAEYYELV